MDFKYFLYTLLFVVSCQKIENEKPAKPIIIKSLNLPPAYDTTFTKLNCRTSNVVLADGSIVFVPTSFNISYGNGNRRYYFQDVFTGQSLTIEVKKQDVVSKNFGIIPNSSQPISNFYEAKIRMDLPNKGGVYMVTGGTLNFKDNFNFSFCNIQVTSSTTGEKHTFSFSYEI